MQVYLDNAATTLPDEDVIKAMVAFWKKNTGNPSSIHSNGRKARAVLENSRKQLAQIVGSKDNEILFTSGGTEANNLILKSLALNGQVKRIISSPIEHHSVLDSLKWIKANTKVEIVFLPVDASGVHNINKLETLLSQQNSPTLVSLMHANNEIGNILDAHLVGSICHKYGALFHSDMVQSFMHIPMNISKLPVDIATGSAHKLHGPKGVGFIYSRTKLPSLVHGGNQERSLRGGTENISGIVGLAKAFELAHLNFNAVITHLQEVKTYLIEQLNEVIPGIDYNGLSADLTKSVPHILNVKLPGNYDNTLLFNLDIEGIYVSEGSACSSGALEGSHVLNAMDGGQAKGNNLRVSFSKHTTKNELDYFVEKLALQ